MKMRLGSQEAPRRHEDKANHSRVTQWAYVYIINLAMQDCFWAHAVGGNWQVGIRTGRDEEIDVRLQASWAQELSWGRFKV
jgi:hypothetical protein